MRADPAMRRMAPRLLAAGRVPAAVWIFSSDGADPGLVDWREFTRDNADVAEDVLEQLRAFGHAFIGGGASPLARVVPVVMP